MRGTLTKFNSLVSSLGMLNSLLYLGDRVLDSVSRGHLRIYKYCFVQQAVPEKPLLPGHRGKKILVEELLDNDERLVQLPRSEEVISARFKQGGRCLAGFIEDVFVGCIWINLGKYEEDEVRCYFVPQPEGQSCWDYDVHIEPEYRLGFAFPRLWDETNTLLRRQGVRWSVSRISAFKPESLKSHSSMGAKAVGSSVYLCAGSIQLMLSTLSPYVHLSLSSDRIPVLSVGLGTDLR